MISNKALIYESPFDFLRRCCSLEDSRPSRTFCGVEVSGLDVSYEVNFLSLRVSPFVLGVTMR